MPYRQGDKQGLRHTKPGEQGERDEKTQSVDVTMRKIDELDEPIDHGIAQGDEGKIRARGKPIKDLLDEDFKWGHRILTCRCKPP